MGELRILLTAIIIINILIISSLFIKEGALLKNKAYCITISILLTAFTLISITSFPSNFIVQKVIAGTIGTLGVILTIKSTFKQNTSNLEKMIIIISIISNTALPLFLR